MSTENDHMEALSANIKNIRLDNSVDLPAQQLVKDIELTDEQQKVCDWIMEQLKETAPFYLHVSGPAGSGKSEILHKLRKLLTGAGIGYLVTAPTGVSAINVDGVTLHSQFELNPYAKNWNDDAKNEKKDLLPSETKLLIIDEISMVSSTLLARVDRRLKKQFNPEKAFGGISIVSFGDLLQLEPISENKIVPFAFKEIPYDSGFKQRLKQNLWSSFKFAELTKNMRTKDAREAEILSSIRTGKNTDKLEEFFNEKGCLLSSGELEDEGEMAFKEYIKPSEFDDQKLIVAPTNEVVDHINAMALSYLPGSIKCYLPIKPKQGEKKPFKLNAKKYTPFENSKLVTSKLPPRTTDEKAKPLRIKNGSIVMLTCNLDVGNGLANGTIGTVVNCAKDAITVNFKKIGLRDIQRECWYDPSFWKGGVFQFPLRPATAVTVHKSQGVTVDSVIVVTQDIFANGHFYTALSRARYLSRSRITRFSPEMCMVSKESVEELNRMRKEVNIFSKDSVNQQPSTSTTTS